MSGAVQDLDAGIILGSGRTFGKGLVQTIEQTPLSTVRRTINTMEIECPNVLFL